MSWEVSSLPGQVEPDLFASRSGEVPEPGSKRDVVNSYRDGDKAARIAAC